MSSTKYSCQRLRTATARSCGHAIARRSAGRERPGLQKGREFSFTVIHSNSLMFTVIHPILKKICGGFGSHTHFLKAVIHRDSHAFPKIPKVSQYFWKNLLGKGGRQGIQPNPTKSRLIMVRKHFDMYADLRHRGRAAFTERAGATGNGAADFGKWKDLIVGSDLIRLFGFCGWAGSCSIRVL